MVRGESQKRQKEREQGRDAKRVQKKKRKESYDIVTASFKKGDAKISLKSADGEYFLVQGTV